MAYNITEDKLWDFANRVRGISSVQGSNVPWLPSLIAYATLLEKGWEPTNREALEEISQYLAYLLPSDTEEWDKNHLPLDGFTNEELAAIVMSPYWENSVRFGEYSTPDSVIQTAIELLNPQPGESVADLCVGTGSFMREVTQTAGFESFFGIDIAYDARMLALARSTLLEVPTSISLGNTFEHIGAYDKVFINGPWGLRIKDIEREIPQEVERIVPKGITIKSTDWLFALHAHANTKSSGLSVIVMTGAPLFNAADAQIREYLIKAGLIKAVVALPKNMYLLSSIPTYLLVMSKENSDITFVDASDLGNEDRRQTVFGVDDIREITRRLSEQTEHSATIGFQDIEAGGWVIDPRRYVADVHISDGVPLSDLLVNVTRGAGISAKELDARVTDEETPYRYLMIKDVVDGEISEELPYLTGISPNEEKYCIEDGDIVLGKMSPFKTAIARLKPGEKILATGNLYILRPDTAKVKATYLKTFFESSIGLKQLNASLVGTAIMSIPIKGLTSILVPMIDLEEQEQFENEYKALVQEIEGYKRKIERAKARMADLFSEGRDV